MTTKLLPWSVQVATAGSLPRPKTRRRGRDAVVREFEDKLKQLQTDLDVALRGLKTGEVELGDFGSRRRR